MVNIKTRILLLALLIGAVALALSIVRFRVLPGEEGIESAIRSIDPAFEQVRSSHRDYRYPLRLVMVHKLESLFIIIAGLNGIFCAIMQRIRPCLDEIATF